jgi:hypothetical protein
MFKKHDQLKAATVGRVALLLSRELEHRSSLFQNALLHYTSVNNAPS